MGSEVPMELGGTEWLALAAGTPRWLDAGAGRRS
jgi:hypothetical protein